MSSLRPLFALLVVAALAACSSTTEPEPFVSPDPSTVPSAGELNVKPAMTAEQARLIDAGLERWRRAQPDAIDGDAGLRFFADASGILNRDQLGSLIHEVRNHRRIDRDQIGDRPGDHRPGNRGHHFGWLRGLDLSEDQRMAMREAHAAYRQTLRRLRAGFRDGSLTEAELRAGVKEARETLQSTIRGLLTEEQRAELDNRHRDRLIRHLERRLENWDDRTARRVQHIGEILDLTQEQTDAIAQVLAEAGVEVGNILAGLQDESLTAAAAREALKTLAEETRAAIMEILDAGQSALYDDLMSACRGRGHQA